MGRDINRIKVVLAEKKRTNKWLAVILVTRITTAKLMSLVNSKEVNFVRF